MYDFVWSGRKIFFKGWNVVSKKKISQCLGKKSVVLSQRILVFPNKDIRDQNKKLANTRQDFAILHSPGSEWTGSLLSWPASWREGPSRRWCWRWNRRSWWNWVERITVYQEQEITSPYFTILPNWCNRIGGFAANAHTPQHCTTVLPYDKAFKGQKSFFCILFWRYSNTHVALKRRAHISSLIQFPKFC